MIADQLEQNRQSAGKLPKAILLAGGFGGSEYLYGLLKKEYDNVNIIRAPYAWSIVARGAVISVLRNSFSSASPKSSRPNERATSLFSRRLGSSLESDASISRGYPPANQAIDWGIFGQQSNDESEALKMPSKNARLATDRILDVFLEDADFRQLLKKASLDHSVDHAKLTTTCCQLLVQYAVDLQDEANHEAQRDVAKLISGSADYILARFNQALLSLNITEATSIRDKATVEDRLVNPLFSERLAQRAKESTLRVSPGDAVKHFLKDERALENLKLGLAQLFDHGQMTIENSEEERESFGYDSDKFKEEDLVDNVLDAPEEEDLSITSPDLGHGDLGTFLILVVHLMTTLT